MYPSRKSTLAASPHRLSMRTQCVWTCTYVYMCRCVRTCVRTCLHVCTYGYVCTTCMCTYISTYMWTYVRTWVCACVRGARAYAFEYACAHVWEYACACMCVYEGMHVRALMGALMCELTGVGARAGTRAFVRAFRVSVCMCMCMIMHARGCVRASSCLWGRPCACGCERMSDRVDAHVCALGGAGSRTCGCACGRACVVYACMIYHIWLSNMIEPSWK